MYGKVFKSIYEGTLYGQWEAIVTLEQMIIIADEFGIVEMTPQAMSGKTSIPLDIIQKGLAALLEPDPDSRTPGEEGRRIVLIDEHKSWGWLIVNYQFYRNLASHNDKKDADKKRISKNREKKNASKSDSNNSIAECSKAPRGVAGCSGVSQSVERCSNVSQKVAHTDTDTDTDTDTFVNKKNTKKEKKSRNKNFDPPAVEQVVNYCIERNNAIDPEQFIDYYIARDWILTNGKKMKCWMAAVRTWERNNFSNGGKKNVGKGKSAVDIVREANNLDESVDREEAIDITSDSELIPY